MPDPTRDTLLAIIHAEFPSPAPTWFGWDHVMRALADHPTEVKAYLADHPATPPAPPDPLIEMLERAEVYLDRALEHLRSDPPISSDSQRQANVLGLDCYHELAQFRKAYYEIKSADPNDPRLAGWKARFAPMAERLRSEIFRLTPDSDADVLP